jgi:hypothetical protein
VQPTVFSSSSNNVRFSTVLKYFTLIFLEVFFLVGYEFQSRLLPSLSCWGAAILIPFVAHRSSFLSVREWFCLIGCELYSFLFSSPVLSSIIVPIDFLGQLNLSSDRT